MIDSSGFGPYLRCGMSDRSTLLGRPELPSEAVQGMLQAAPAEMTGVRREMRAVLFSDITGSTAYFERYGDEAGLRLIERHNRLLLPLVQKHSGRLVKTIGDALMVEFPGACEAVQAAVGMMWALAEHNRSQPEEERIRIRIGINFGEVLVRGGDLFGDTVNAAARVEALAAPETILISAAAHRALGEEPIASECRPFDAVLVKGKSEPLEVFEVRWDPQAPPAPGPRPVASAGSVIGGRFRVLSLLGEGGMGQVYCAHDGALDETVALKFIHPHLAARRESLELFKREVKLARAVTHPNVCRIHEFLHMEGQDFLSMELVTGRSLESRIREEGPLPVEEALRIARQLCAGLAEAHRRGVVHQDLKPANVLIEEGSGRAVITDFGIARLAEKEARPGARAARVAGTPEYMAPEQAQGLPPGPAADLYSLGIILFEMLLGQPPFTAPSAGEVLVQQVTRPAPDVAALRPDLPPVLIEAVRACLHKDPRRRPKDAEALLRLLGGEKSRRSLLPWVALAGALAAGALVLFFLLSGPRPPGGERRVTPLFSTGALERVPRVRPDGAAVAFVRDGAVWTAAYPSPAPAPVKLFSPDAGAPISGLAWWGSDSLLVSASGAALRLGLDGQHEPLSGIGADCPLDVAADGRHYCTCRKNAEGFLDLVAGQFGGPERVLLAADGARSFERPRFSPDARRIALVVAQGGFRTARDIGVIPADGGELLLLTRDGIPQRLNHTDPAWTPDGRWLVYSSRRSGTQALWCVPSRGGESFPLSPGATAGQYAPDPWPDGTSLAFEVREERQDLVVTDLGGGGTAHVGDERASNRFPVFSPDGRHLAYRTLRSEDDEDEGAAEIVVADSERDEEKRFAAPAGTRELCWCGTERILFARTQGEDRQLLELTLSSGTLRTLARGFSGLWSPHADPSCRRVVFSASKNGEAGRRLYEIRMPDGEPAPLTPAGETAVFPALSPDGSRVAFRQTPDPGGAGAASLRLLDGQAKAARLVSTHASFERSQRRLRWAADGKSLFYLEPEGNGARLWQVPVAGGAPRPVRRVPEISTFDFDLTADGERLVVPVARTSADVYRMEGIEW